MKRKLDQSKIENCSSDKNKWNRIIMDKKNNIVEEKIHKALYQMCYFMPGPSFLSL